MIPSGEPVKLNPESIAVGVSVFALLVIGVAGLYMYEYSGKVVNEYMGVVAEIIPVIRGPRMAYVDLANGQRARMVCEDCYRGQRIFVKERVGRISGSVTYSR